MSAGSKLPRSFYDRDTLRVARDLLGKVLAYRDPKGVVRRGRIVETEAYKGPRDRASHAHRGLTPRNALMFGPPGYAYVYLIYGVHHCLNTVTERDGYPAAVLLRALDPIDGLEGNSSGPGLLCRSMGLSLEHNGLDLVGDQLWIEDGLARDARPVRLGRDRRVGVDYAGAWADRPWRFFDLESAFISRRPKLPRSPGRALATGARSREATRRTSRS